MLALTSEQLKLDSLEKALNEVATYAWNAMDRGYFSLDPQTLAALTPYARNLLLKSPITRSGAVHNFSLKSKPGMCGCDTHSVHGPHSIFPKPQGPRQRLVSCRMHNPAPFSSYYLGHGWIRAEYPLALEEEQPEVAGVGEEGVQWWRSGLDRRPGLQSDIILKFGPGGWAREDMAMALSGQRHNLLRAKQEKTEAAEINAEGGVTTTARKWASWVDNIKYKGYGCDFDVIGGEETETFLETYADAAAPVVLRGNTTEHWDAWAL